MCSFDRAILVGGVSSCGIDFISKGLKEFMHFGVFVEFPALVHDDTFVVAVGGGVFAKCFLHPIEG